MKLYSSFAVVAAATTTLIDVAQAHCYIYVSFCYRNEEGISSVLTDSFNPVRLRQWRRHRHLRGYPHARLQRPGAIRLRQRAREGH